MKTDHENKVQAAADQAWGRAHDRLDDIDRIAIEGPSPDGEDSRLIQGVFCLVAAKLRDSKHQIENPEKDIEP